VDVDELRHALGGVVLEAAYLERTLRTALGSGWALVEDQLRQELGHEVRAEPRA